MTFRKDSVRSEDRLSSRADQPVHNSGRGVSGSDGGGKEGYPVVGGETSRRRRFGGCRFRGLGLFLLLLLIHGCDRPGPSQGGWRSERTGRHPGSEEGSPPIRVFLRESGQERIQCRGGACFLTASPEDELFRLADGQSKRLRREGGHWRLEDGAGRAVWSSGDSSDGPIQILEVRPEGEGILAVGTEGESRYRGVLRFAARGADRFAIVNVLDIEDYLAGVVGSEMPSHWHKAALRAQCIAARTYAIYTMNCYRRADWDLGSTQASQVYRGLESEVRRIREVVDETRGLVLAYGPADRERIFPTFYSSTCGGHTQDAGAVFGVSAAPLKGRRCPHCGAVAPAGRYRWPAVNIGKEQASDLLLKRYSMLRRLERVATIEITRRSDYGRVEQVVLTGVNGQRRRIGGEELRLALTDPERPLLSSWYRLADAGEAWRFEDGHGWGHGVGLCQYGSEQMAKRGKDSVAILDFYYPQSMLLRAY